MNNKFIVFEGIDGSGKSTQANLLVEYLNSIQQDALFTCEPTNNSIGTHIRNILTGKASGHPITVSNLFAADRYDHITNADYGILAQLKNQHVVCDRYLLSSYAYQGLDAPIDWIKTINSYSEQLLWPDLTFYIQIEPKLALERILQNRAQIDLFETMDKLTGIYNNYQTALATLSMEQRKHIFVIDGTLTIEEIKMQIIDICRQHLAN